MRTKKSIIPLVLTIPVIIFAAGLLLNINDSKIIHADEYEAHTELRYYYGDEESIVVIVSNATADLYEEYNHPYLEKKSKQGQWKRVKKYLVNDTLDLLCIYPGETEKFEINISSSYKVPLTQGDYRVVFASTSENRFITAEFAVINR